MTASFARPANVIPMPEQWRRSPDALNIAEDIWKLGDKIKDHGSALIDYPTDAAIRQAARADARAVLALCDDLERLA